MPDINGNLPYSLEAEQSVLGAILLDPDKFPEVAGIITSDDFSLAIHGETYNAMRDLFNESRAIDTVTLIDRLVKNGVYEKNEESTKYITVIAQTVPTSSNILDYARIVKDKATLRKLIEASDEIRSMASAAQGDVKDIVDRSEQLIFEVSKGQDSKSFIHIRNAISAMFGKLQLLSEDPSSASGTPTGFSGLDSVLVGMGEGDLIFVGARPGVGKTSFALNIAINVAKNTKKTVCIFSLEMSAEQITSRMLSSEGCVDSVKLRTGKLEKEDWKKLGTAASILSKTDILIDDTSGITVTGMKAKLRRVKNLGLIIVDYLQLMQGDKRRDNRVLEVGDISRGLKLLSKDLGVPCICCAQLSRTTEARKDQKPMLSDLRESGSIEQDADVVMFLSRDYYQTDPEKLNTAECYIAKNRHGSTGSVNLGWYPSFTKFCTQDDVHDEEDAPGGKMKRKDDR